MAHHKETIRKPLKYKINLNYNVTKAVSTTWPSQAKTKMLLLMVNHAKLSLKQ
jgi:hypothetical protein